MSRARRWRTSGTVRGSTGGRAGSPDGAGGEVEQRSVAQIPGKSARATSTSVMCLYHEVEAADLIVIQSEVFGVFKILFNVPACANRLHHLWQGGSLRGKNEVVRFLVGIGEAATNEHPMAPIIFPSMQHGDASPVKKSGTLGSFTHREALPIVGSKPEGFDFTDLHPSALPIKSQYSHRLITGNGQHIRVLTGFQPRT